jgi:hypothetical protein
MKRIITMTALVLWATACTTSFEPTGDTSTDGSPDTGSDTTDVETDGPGGHCGAGLPACPPWAFCETDEGVCAGDTGVVGECVERPVGDCPDIYDPECGCDGITYGNGCERQAAGVDLDHGGECFSGTPCAVGDPFGCPDGEVCEGFPGLCIYPEIPGICIVMPTCAGYEPECGCDYMTYENRCARLTIGVPLLHEGECGEFCITDGDCPGGYFCEQPPMDCDATEGGMCMRAPDWCPEEHMPVCSCAGDTYMNDCYRIESEADLRLLGPC